MLSQEVAICVAGVGQCAFESREACKSLCFHNKSDCAGSRKLVVRDAVCETLCAQCYVGRWAHLFFEIFACIVTLGEARHDYFPM